MAKKPYLPKDDEGKSRFQKTFGLNLPTYKTKYNVANADVIRIQDGGPYFRFLLDSIEEAEKYKQGLVNYKNIMRDGIPSGVDPTTVVLPTLASVTAPANTPPPGIFPHATSIGNAIKQNTNYVEADGEDMGLEGAEKPHPDTVNGQPVIKAVLKGILVWILWTKGLFDGVYIEVDRGDGAGWKFLANDSNPDHVDTEALPAQAAQWKYRAWYFLLNKQGGTDRVGKVSDETSIVVKA